MKYPANSPSFFGRVFCGLRRAAIVALAITAAACSSTGSTSRPTTTDRAVEPEFVQPSDPQDTLEQQLFENEGRDSADVDALASRRPIDMSIEAFTGSVPERIARAYERALTAMAVQNWSEAELELQQLILDEPGFPGAYVNLGIIYRQTDRLADARYVLEQAIAIDPTFAPASNELGLVLREAGDFAAAEVAYQRAIAADPTYAIAHYNLGILLDLYLRRTADALTHYAAYQGALAEPDETVGRWIVDLERRARTAAERVAQD